MNQKNHGNFLHHYQKVLKIMKQKYMNIYLDRKKNL